MLKNEQVKWLLLLHSLSLSHTLSLHWFFKSKILLVIIENKTSSCNEEMWQLLSNKMYAKINWLTAETVNRDVLYLQEISKFKILILDIN